jgi:hypothetical protein
VSEVQFSNIAGAIDGILIWILKPLEEDANNAGCGRRNFFLWSQGKIWAELPGSFRPLWSKFGFFDWIAGASLDCIAFEGSSLYERLEGGLLKNGLVLFGDNAYPNTRYMATPFPNNSSGCKDN